MNWLGRQDTESWDRELLIDGFRLFTGEARNPRPRVLVVDDDPIFCKQMEKAGKQMGIRIKTCATLAAIAALSDTITFDAAIIDYYFGELTGSQLSFLTGRNVPTFLTSATERSRIPEADWPTTVRDFLPKSLGVTALLESVLKAANDSPLAFQPNPSREKSLSALPFLIGVALLIALLLLTRLCLHHVAFRDRHLSVRMGSTAFENTLVIKKIA